MKHFPLTVLLALIATGIFAQVPPKPSEKAVVYDAAGMLTPEDKVSIELTGLKLQSKYDSKLLFISVETKGNMKGLDFVRAIYSGWGISDGVKGHCGIIVVCKKQIMASVGGGFLVKCDNALTMKIKDSFQELLDKTTLPPFANIDNQNQQKGSAALKDSYMFFANAMFELSQEEAPANTQADDSTTTTLTAKTTTEAVPPSKAPPSPTEAPPMVPSAPTAERTMASPTPTALSKTIWIISGLIINGVVGIIFLFKKCNRSHTPNNKKQYRHKDYDSNDYRDDK
ncbi:MAG: hypothetical protein IKN52_05180 [Victivallales bacterium]|nr:hypothetical protein [Victivallales bacterium]